MKRKWKTPHLTILVKTIGTNVIAGCKTSQAFGGIELVGPGHYQACFAYYSTLPCPCPRDMKEKKTCSDQHYWGCDSFDCQCYHECMQLDVS